METRPTDSTENSSKSNNVKKDNLRNYVGKLNDRNLQRKRESGITTYALYSILLLAIFKIIDLYPKIPFKECFWDVIYIAALTINLLYFSYAIFTIAESVGNNNPSKKLLFLNKRKYGISIIRNFWLISSNTFGIIISILSSIYFAVNYQRALSNVLVIPSLIIMNIQNCVFIALMAIAYIKNSKDSSESVLENSFKKKKKLSFNNYEYLVVILIIFFIFISMFIFNTKINKLDTTIFFSLISSILLLLDKVFDLSRNDTYIKSMEHLEYEIYLLDLSDDEIKAKLQSNFMGYFVNQFIADDVNKVNLFSSKIDNKVLALNDLIKAYREVNQAEIPFEYTGRKAKADEEKGNLLKEINDFYYNKISEVRYLIERSNLDDEESAQLSSYLDNLKNKQTESISKIDNEDTLKNIK